jgi:uncharacterized protein involved in exopolysaccharide biosynthesis
LGSAAVRDRIIERFDLYNHYEISEDSQYRNTAVRNVYNSRITSSRTKYGAVEVRVRDKDPVMAAAIANEMVALSDSIQNEIRHQRAQLAYKVALQRYESVRDEVISVEDSLRAIMQRGMYHFESQTERLTQQYAIDLSRNNTQGLRVLENQLAVVRDLGGAYMTQRAHLEQVSRGLFPVQRIMQEAKMDLENVIPFKFLIDEAFISEKKVYPVRWLIVFLATFSAGFFGVLSLMTYENLVKRGIIQTKI